MTDVAHPAMNGNANDTKARSFMFFIEFIFRVFDFICEESLVAAALQQES